MTVYTEIPPRFNPVVEASANYCVHDKHLLLVKRHPSKDHGMTWGVPAGKLEQGETKEQTATRELYEETGIIIDETDLVFLRTLYVKGTVDFLFHMFFLDMDKKHPIILPKNELIESAWVPFNEVKKLPLVPGGAAAFDEFLSFVNR